MKGRIYSFEEMPERGNFTCDVVVVGSGAGGAVSASRLAEAGFKVIVVEEGRRFTPDEFPGDFVTAMELFYREKGMRSAMGNTVITVPCARMLGGTTTVNSSICFRIPEFVLDEWEEATGFEVDREEMWQHYSDIEKFLQVGKPRPEILTGNDKLHKKAADLMGWRNDYFDLNSPGCEGCNRCNIGCPVGGKTSMDVSFIPHAIENGAQVFTCTRAEKIIVERGVAKGVECRVVDHVTGKEKGYVTIRAKAVVLACGAIETPVLLMKNKLCGSSGWLGKNLHVHPGVGVFGFFPDEEIKMWRGVFQGHYIDEFIEDGFVIETATVPPEAVALVTPSMGKGLVDFLKDIVHFSSSGAMIRDSSSGTVKPAEGERVKITYYVNEDDLKKYREGIEKISLMLFKAGAQWVRPGLYRNIFIRNESEIHHIINHLTPADLFLYGSHPQGTARMGRKKDRTVVNVNGETHDVEMLFVTDASVFPLAAGVNPQMTIMALSSYLSRRIAERI